MLEKNDEQKVPYYEISGFEDVFLEDSWVYEIREDSSELVFSLDFVLREKHKLYAPPLSNEQYCYRRGYIRFHKPSAVTWLRKTMTPYVDVTGEADFGNIDTFYFFGDHFHLEGGWGELEIVSPPPTIDFVEAKKTAG